jgi:hypothetical protein
MRDALWAAGPLPWLGLAILYVVLTLGPSRQLVASKRLDYWRQCPISPNRWRAFHGIHLTVLHSPALVALGYGLAPAGRPVAIAVPVLVALATIGPLAWRLGHPVTEMRTLTLRLPRPRTATTALARILVLALARRRPAASAGIVLTSLSLALLGWVATAHVHAAGEPPAPAAWGFGAVSSTVGAVAVWVSWPLVRRQQWWFDSLDVRGWSPVLASIGVAAVVALPAFTVLAGSASILGLRDTLLLAWVVLATYSWAGAITFALDADAVRRRFPEMRRKGRFTLALALPVPLAAWQPPLLLIPVVAALLRARHVGIAAEAVRRRFELDDPRDDHE